MTRRGVEMVAGSPLFRDLPILLFMSGKPARCAKKLDWARRRSSRRRLDVEDRADARAMRSASSPATCASGIDMLIMGAFGHSPLRSLLFGSKTADLLRSAKIPTLLLR
jgi:hypothetical protein